jgi:excisionase family DNA binding protein
MNEYKLEMTITCATGDADHFYNTVLMIAKGFEIGVVESKLCPVLPKNQPQTPTSMPVKSQKITMDMKEAAAFLNISKQTLYRYTSAATIPHFKLGSRTLFKVSELEEWLEDHRIKSHG